MSNKYPIKSCSCGASHAAGTVEITKRGGAWVSVSCSGSVSAPATGSVSAPATDPRSRPSLRMGSGHGHTRSVAGSSSYCTGNEYCRCYDCAS